MARFPSASARPYSPIEYQIQAREASDHRRYQELYGVDYHDRDRYDLVMDTDRRPPEDVAREIIAHARAHFAR